MDWMCVTEREETKRIPQFGSPDNWEKGVMLLSYERLGRASFGWEGFQKLRSGHNIFEKTVRHPSGKRE